MTKEEAIEELKILKEDYWDDDGYGHETKQYDDTMLALDMAIEALEQEPCEDVISRKSIKQKLQEHHDFFDNAYGGFSNLPQNDKSRVDEITNCIAMVVNEPSVTPQEPKTGHWIANAPQYDMFNPQYICSECGNAHTRITPYCEMCGAKMESEDNNGSNNN